MSQNVFGLGNTNTDKLFLEYIMPGMNVEIRENTVLYDRFKTNSESVVGKYAVFKNITGSPKSARPSSSSEFPTARQGTYDEFVIWMKRGMYAQLQFDGLSMACSQGKGAVMDILRAEVKGIESHISNKMNRQYWGDGSGRLAQLDAASSNSTTVTINHPWFGKDSNAYTQASQYLDEGMEIDIYDTSGNLEAEAVEIESITDDADGTATLVLKTAVTASDDAWIFDHDTYASSQKAGEGVPMGLMGIISTSNPYCGITQTYFQNVDRSATGKGWSKGTIVANASAVAAPSNVSILKLVQECEKWGRTKVLISNLHIWRVMYQLLEADRTAPNDPALWGGLTGITFYAGRAGKIPFIYDEDAPDQRIIALDEAYLANYSPVKNGMAWLPGDNGILTRVNGKDESTASLIWYYNFGCEKTRSCGILTNVKHATS